MIPLDKDVRELLKRHPIYNATNGWTIQGPYNNKERTQDICIIKENLRMIQNSQGRTRSAANTRKTLSFARFLMECYHGRVLDRADKVYYKDYTKSASIENCYVKYHRQRGRG